MEGKSPAEGSCGRPCHLANVLSVLYCMVFYGNNKIPRFNLLNSRFSLTGNWKKTTR
jgi:hypothetical protein